MPFPRQSERGIAHEIATRIGIDDPVVIAGGHVVRVHLDIPACGQVESAVTALTDRGLGQTRIKDAILPEVLCRRSAPPMRH